MDEKLVNRAEDGAVQEPAAKSNTGWFRPADGRINRQGRPRGSKTVPPGKEAYCAPRADRLMLLYMPARVLAFRLANELGPYAGNLPMDIEVVACQWERTRKGFYVTIRHRTFPKVAKGSVIPELTLNLRGERFIKWTD